MIAAQDAALSPSLLGLLSARGLKTGIAAAVSHGDTRTDFRTAVSDFEDDLFACYPAGHGRLVADAARRTIERVFAVQGRAAPELKVVPGFDDPSIGGFADLAGNRIAIAKGYLYRFLILHESAHFIVPDDRRHGPAFTYVLQLLYRGFLHIPEAAMQRFLRKHGLPSYIGPSGA
jgi:hypothetical protein